MICGGKMQKLRWWKGLMHKRIYRMITCKEFEEFVLRYLDDELSKPQRSVFELHMRVCRECREYLAAYRRTTDLGRAALSLPNDPVPADVPENLIKAVLDAK